MNFIAPGILTIFGLLPGTHAVGTSNLAGHGGFFPHGYGAVVTGLLIAADPVATDPMTARR